MYRREVRYWKARDSVAQATDSCAEVGANADVDDDNADSDGDNLSAEDVEDSEYVSGREDRWEESIVKADREGGDGKGSTTESVLDMYNALDGSALMAIGTLVVVDF